MALTIRTCKSCKTHNSKNLWRPQSMEPSHPRLKSKKIRSSPRADAPGITNSKALLAWWSSSTPANNRMRLIEALGSKLKVVAAIRILYSSSNTCTCPLPMWPLRKWSFKYQTALNLCSIGSFNCTRIRLRTRVKILQQVMAVFKVMCLLNRFRQLWTLLLQQRSHRFLWKIRII